MTDTGDRRPPRAPATGGRAGRRRRGQAIIFVIVVTVILFFTVLWNFDLHKILRTKYVSRNGGDAAALMAARWQGVSLNLIGDLNLMHALALTAGDAEAADAIVNAQARLCYVGPMVAFMASQQAAKNNGIYQNDAFSKVVRDHANTVRSGYTAVTPGGGMLFPEPYPNCWREYADMLDLIANEGVAAGADNARFYNDYVGGHHYLLMAAFYEAIAGRSWCWFYLHAPNLLTDYRNFQPCWWDPLPPMPHMSYINSEIFGLGLVKVITALTNVVDLDTAEAVAKERDMDSFISDEAASTSTTWYCYGSRTWGAWDALSPTNSDPFPVTGTVKPQYDYAGADAVARIEAQVGRLTPGRKGAGLTNTILWTAAAKPFGYLDDDQKPNTYDLVMPAFHDARLIALDASSMPSGGSFDISWRIHVEDHLPKYMRDGPQHNGCWYCQQLVTWEDGQFRASGVEWLSTNSALCTLRGGGGGGGGHGGGSRSGH